MIQCRGRFERLDGHEIRFAVLASGRLVAVVKIIIEFERDGEMPSASI